MNLPWVAGLAGLFHPSYPVLPPLLYKSILAYFLLGPFILQGTPPLRLGPQAPRLLPSVLLVRGTRSRLETGRKGSQGVSWSLSALGGVSGSHWGSALAPDLSGQAHHGSIFLWAPITLFPMAPPLWAGNAFLFWPIPGSHSLFPIWILVLPFPAQPITRIKFPLLTYRVVSAFWSGFWPIPSVCPSQSSYNCPGAAWSWGTSPGAPAALEVDAGWVPFPPDSANTPVPRAERPWVGPAGWWAACSLPELCGTIPQQAQTLLLSRWQQRNVFVEASLGIKMLRPICSC